ncbi:MAG: DoxX family membrane protein [Chitinophagaceae bacterium]
MSLVLLVVLYIGAGINHFWHPQFYTEIIPPYLPFRSFLVYSSGIVEIILGLLLIIKKSRRMAALLIAIMLILFLPVHIFMLQQAYTLPHYRVTEGAALFRLLLQPVLILWVLWQRKASK